MSRTLNWMLDKWRGDEVRDLRCLNLSGADSGLLVVRSKLRGFSRNALEDV